MLAFRSHVIASHCPRLFQPPRSRTKPTLPDLVCSCIGVSQSQPSTYRIALSKRKNPMMFWWGKSRWHGQSVSSPRVFRVSSAVVTHPRHFFHAPPKNHGVNCSWLTIRLPHLTVWIIHSSVKLQTTGVLNLLIAASAALAQLSTGKPLTVQCREFLQAHSVILPTVLIVVLSCGYCKARLTI